MMQALLRMAVIVTSALYTLIAYAMDDITATRLWAILVYCFAFSVINTDLIIRILQKPGTSTPRSMFALVVDSIVGIITITIGGEAMLPVYSVMLSMTLCHGMRCGRTYLLMATAFALASLALMIKLTPYLQQRPTVTVMMILAMLVMPLFVYFLLSSMHMALEETQALNEARSRFLAQASHDLRQPIHSISLFTACLRDGQLDMNERRLVDNIERALSAVEQLFRSLLDIYTLNQGDIEGHLENIDVDALLSNLVIQNSEAANWAGVAVRLRPCRQHVRCDAALLRTLLQNLLSNAFKYAPGKSVLIGCRQHKGKLSIGVYDLGRGISAEHLPHLCNEFYRVRDNRDRDIEGVGLGLSIVSRIVRLLKLQLSIKSRPDRGTSVIISDLPIVPANIEALAPDIDWSKRLLGGLRVLLIEDNHNVLQATAMLLRKWGCEVQTASVIPQTRVDCDIVVTDLDRTATISDIITHLRELQGRRILAIVITGHDLHHAQQSVDSPYISIMSKPARPAELRSLLLSFKINQMQSPGCSRRSMT
ncbi:ATP-binding response regulator [Pseudomonas viridiflava]|uniref:ATP-binding response regulator n=1 Tax=Pseudomonas viridiflava TaxID=33069 RepID=UPI001C31E2C5|nr:hybrid sensor histidine kinase/response regulator [Pseudomonas viridiflava]QXG50056.1 hybrid sensor histidine kinase/response regulator [Pseudomonas viridiflava]